jgi:hypothetical protein
MAEAVAFEDWLPPLGVLVTSVQFAQVRRVLLAKCSVREPLPKKERDPTRVEEYLSVYDAVKGSEVMSPYLPARSPTWQVWGSVASQGGAWNQR